jgi:hypothetical protein
MNPPVSIFSPILANGELCWEGEAALMPAPLSTSLVECSEHVACLRVELDGISRFQGPCFFSHKLVY